MVLPLGLWLLWALAASQEICRSPGELPAPLLIMDKGSAHHGESIILLCFVPTDTSATRVIFCKDGKEISTLPMDRKKMFFESVQPASPESVGNYSCRYQHKDDRNQEKNSLPSASRYLSAPDGPSPPGGDSSGREPSPPDPNCCNGSLGPIVGLALVAGLALGLLGCFLMKAVVSRRRTRRDPGPDQSNPVLEDQIHYAQVTRTRANLEPRQDGHEAVTYAAIGKGSSRVQDAWPAP